MGRYVEGWNRSQSVLLPESVDDYVGEDNPVRVGRPPCGVSPNVN